MADAQATTTTPAAAPNAAANTAASGVANTATATDVEDIAASTGGDTKEVPAGDQAATNADDGEDIFAGKEGKDDAGKTEGDDSGDDSVPENYDFKVPDGMELDKGLAEEFSPIAKELGLSNAKAQKLVDLYSSKILPQAAAQQAANLRAIQKQWATEARNDPEFGGNNFETSKGHVARARAWMGEDFAKEISVLGIGNNPRLLKGLAKLGKALAEDAPMGGAPVAATKEAKAILYPEQSKG